MSSNPAPSLSQYAKHPGALALALATTLLFGYWIWQRYTHVSTDDARIAATMVSVSSKAAGRLVDFPVGSGDRLSAGQKIGQIDARDVELRTRELQSQLEAMSAMMERAEMEIGKVRGEVSGKIHAAESGLDAVQARRAAAEADLGFKENEWKRVESLRAQQMVSRKEWESSKNALEQARRELQRAEAEVASTRAKLSEAQAQHSGGEMSEREYTRLKFQREGLALSLARERVNLLDRTLEAPLAGVVDKTFANPGEYVNPGQRLLLMHDPKHIWIDANVKETEVRHLKVGNKVKVSIDAYPDRSFEGRLERIGNAATNQFALLPAPNPSGNFTKITQRLPVRIAIDQVDDLLKPGMMAEVSIEIR